MERLYLPTVLGDISYLERKGHFPLVFLHGLGGSGNNWLKLAQYLPETYRLIMPDLPGHGRSTKSLEHHSVADQVEYLRLFIEGLQLDRYALVGNSYGGWVSMRFSSDVVNPQYLVLVDSAGINPTVGEFSGESIDGFLDRVMKMNPKNDRDIISRIVAMNATGKEKLMKEDLMRLPRNTLIIWGEKDRLIPVEYGRKLSEMIPGSSFASIPDGGHIPHSTHPSEVAALITGFIRIS